METPPVLEFKLDKKGLWNIREMYLIWIAAIYIVIAIFILLGYTSPVLINNVKQTGFVAACANFAPLLFLFIVSFIFQQLFIRNNYKGLVIRTNGEIIEMIIPSRGSTSFYFSEINNIGRTAQGIYLYSKGGKINIPKQIDRYDELVSLLKSKFPSLNTDTLTFYHKYYSILVFIAVILLISCSIFENKLLLAVNGLIFMGLLLGDLRTRYLSYKIVKSKATRKIIIYELIAIAVALYVLIPKLIK
jgi:hypothetical protein